MTPKDKASTTNLHQKLGAGTHEPFENLEPETELLDHPSYKELQNRLTEMEKKAEEFEKKTSEYYDRMLRMQAETDNMHRRVERDIENAHKYALEKFTLELLPVIDSLERAVDAHGEDKKLLAGIQMTLDMFNKANEKFGIKQIDPIGQPFNPEFHQAVSTQPDPSVKPNTVISVLQKGYTLNNRLVRPALVVVSKA